jgi:hypothetical protein
MGRMNTDHARPEDLAALREALETDAPLGWDAVRAFEADHGIVVPEPYRTFVAEFGDGAGSGPPHYGLIPLTDQPSDWGNYRPVRELAKPFPLTEELLWVDDPRPDSELDLVLAPVFDHGSILLGTDGCGMYWHLIVTGSSRGHIWLIDENGALPFGTEFGLTSGESGFTGWVRHWADGKDWFDAA